MSCPEEVSEALHTAFHNGDAEEFRRLLRAHPEGLVDDDGTDLWMFKAATVGSLPLLAVLVELGVGVNLPHLLLDPENPLFEPEGPINQAAANGHTDIVRYLLDHGAKINYVVQGVPRCKPLTYAATNGHLGVVKLLVERGADVHATWRGVNAVTQAEDFGQFAVRDYLRTLGARTLRETTPPDYPGTHQRLVSQIAAERGRLGIWRREIPGEPLVVVRHIPASEASSCQTLFSVGLSDHRLPRREYEFACTELQCLLPSDWPLDEASLQDSQWNWPLKWFERAVRVLRSAPHWPDGAALFLNSDPPAPLTPDTQLCGWIALKNPAETVQAPDHRWIDRHTLFPIYADELDLLRHSGEQELIERFDAREIPLCIDPHRANVATGG